MKKAILLISLALVLVAAAGVMGGVLLTRHADQPPSGQGSYSLVALLNLNAQQAEQMRGIWQKAQPKVSQPTNELKDLNRHRDDEILALMTDQQKKQFADLSEKYRKRADDLSRKRREALGNAIEQTHQILDPAQWQKYQLILRHWLGCDPATAGLDDGHGCTEPHDDGPATQPGGV